MLRYAYISCGVNSARSAFYTLFRKQLFRDLNKVAVFCDMIHKDFSSVFVQTLSFGSFFFARRGTNVTEGLWFEIGVRISGLRISKVQSIKVLIT